MVKKNNKGLNLEYQKRKILMINSLILKERKKERMKERKNERKKDYRNIPK